MRLKTPITATNANTAQEKKAECPFVQVLAAASDDGCKSYLSLSLTLLSMIRCINTKPQATKSVSSELEKVCVWYVQVT